MPAALGRRGAYALGTVVRGHDSSGSARSVRPRGRPLESGYRLYRPLIAGVYGRRGCRWRLPALCGVHFRGRAFHVKREAAEWDRVASRATRGCGRVRPIARGRGAADKAKPPGNFMRGCLTGASFFDTLGRRYTFVCPERRRSA